MMPLEGETNFQVARLNKIDFALALIIFVAMFAASLAFCIPGVAGTFHDDGVYINVSKALAAGDGYRIISFPGEPAQMKYPILYPLILAAVWIVHPRFPDNLIGLQLVSVFSASAFLSLSYLYLVRFNYASRVVALCACLICLTIPGFAFFGGQVLSEMPFALSLIGCLWALDAYCEKQPKSFLAQEVVGLAITLPASIRLIGWVAPTAALIILWRRRLLSRTLVFSALVGSLLSTSHVVMGMSSKTGGASDRIQSYQDSYLEWAIKLGLWNEVAIVSKNLQETLALTTKTLFCGLSQGIEPTPINFILFTAGGLVSWFFVVYRVKNLKPLSMVVVAYAVVVLCWPWPPFRFLIPLLPFLTAGLLSFSEFCLAKVNTRLQSAIVLLAVAMMATNAKLMNNVITYNHATQMPLISVPRNGTDWSGYLAVLDWVKRNTVADDTLACTYDGLTYLYTGRRCIRPYELNIAAAYYGQEAPPLGTLDELAESLKRYKVQYLIVTPQPGYAEEGLAYKLANDLGKEYRGQVAPAYISKDGRFFVLRTRFD